MPAPTPRPIAADPLDVRHDPGTILPVEDDEAVKSRSAAWRDGFRPASAEDEWLFGQVVVNSVRVDACQRLEAELRRKRSSAPRSPGTRTADATPRRSRSRSLATPPALFYRLLATKQGCEWLLDRWRALGAALMERGTWTEAQRVLAVNLLGTPVEFRDAPVWHSPADVVADEVARLLLLKSTALDALDARERAAAEKGLAAEPGEAVAKVRRYEAVCMRQFLWARGRLLARPEPGPADRAEAVAPRPEADAEAGRGVAERPPRGTRK